MQQTEMSTSRRELFAGGVAALLASAFAPSSPLAKDGSLNKKFKISADQIRPIATGRGGAYASDDIMVAGKPIGYMYREQPDNSSDSGWRFLSGEETDAYTNDANNFGFYDVNTIANYGPEIIPLLDSPMGSAYFRGPNGLTPDHEGHPAPK
jgi:hypothetical protein